MITLGLIVLLLVWFVFFRAKPEEKVPVGEAGVSFSNVQLVGNNGGVRQWELVSKALRQADDLFYLDDLEYLLLLENSQPKYYIEAEKATWDRKANVLILNNDVVVDDRSGFRLLTNSLIWHSDEEYFNIYGDTVVTFNKGGEANE